MRALLLSFAIPWLDPLSDSQLRLAAKTATQLAILSAQPLLSGIPLSFSSPTPSRRHWATDRLEELHVAEEDHRKIKLSIQVWLIFYNLFMV